MYGTAQKHVSAAKNLSSHKFTECFYSLKEDSLFAALEWLRDQGLASCWVTNLRLSARKAESFWVPNGLTWKKRILDMKMLYFDNSVYLLCDVIQMLIFHLGEIQNHLPRPVHNACKWPLGISVCSESDCTRVIWTLRLLLIGKLHLFIVVTDTWLFFFFSHGPGCLSRRIWGLVLSY